MNSRDKRELNKFFKDRIIPLVKKKYSIEKIDEEGGIVLSFNDLLD